jgi:peptidoglycan/LPS O-acetylase OafA/YrhL
MIHIDADGAACSGPPASQRRAQESTMSETNPLPALLVIAAALLTISLWGRLIRAPEGRGRHTSIDGLRGYLALFVFVHHACVWHFFLPTGVWESPPSNLYTHFGPSSVTLFFMITGFLFVSRIIADHSSRIDWLRMLVARVLRLAPLYLLVLLLMAGVVAIVSGGRLAVAPTQALADMFRWASFTILGAPDLNHVADTWRITAGVTWSLPYEWLFYFSLPLLAVLAGTRVAGRYLIGSAIVVIAILMAFRPLTVHLISFLGGIAAAVAAKSDSIRRFAESTTASFAVCLCLLLLVAAFPVAGSYPQIVLLSLAFILIACGNSIFGILTHRLSRSLGEIAYSVYLLHGMLLYTLFSFIVGIDASARLSASAYWGFVIALTPALISACVLSYLWVERPGIRSTQRVLGWMRRPASGRN